MTGGFTSSRDKKQLSVEETLSINPRKSLLIVRAGSERFLIASDTDKTTLISKLEDVKPAKNRSLPGITEENIDFPEVITLPAEESDLAGNAASDEVTENPDEITDKKAVHLEVITDKNPNSARLNRNNSYTSRNYSKNNTRTTTSCTS